MDNVLGATTREEGWLEMWMRARWGMVAATLLVLSLEYFASAFVTFGVLAQGNAYATALILYTLVPLPVELTLCACAILWTARKRSSDPSDYAVVVAIVCLGLNTFLWVAFMAAPL